MAKHREPMRKFYYDPTKYRTYLEQLGVTYPTVRGAAAPTAAGAQGAGQR
jgi:aminobenzoyl-glutamate utilization protein B